MISKKTSIFFSNLKRKAPDLKYLIVPELHKDRIHYHFHALISNIGDIQLTDSGIIKNGYKIYNFDDWGYGFSTVTKVSDSGRVSSYISKYISKELMSVTFGKKRYWASRNCNRAQVSDLNLSFDELNLLLNNNMHLLLHSSSVTLNSIGQHIQYLEMKKEGFLLQ